MHPSAETAPSFRPWKLALAMLPLALVSGALLINSRTASWIEPTPDWLLRSLLLVGAALLARALGVRLLGAGDGPVLARRSLFALWPLGLIGLAFSGRFLGLQGAQIFFGLPLATAWAVAWRPWMRRQGAWLALAAAAGFAAIWLMAGDSSPISGASLPLLPHGLRRGLVAGAGLWLLSAPAALWLAGPADADQWLADPDESRLGRRLGLGGWGILAAALIYAVAAQGLQNCRWLDLALRRSGCVAGLWTGEPNARDIALTPDGTALFALEYDRLQRIPLDSFAVDQTVTLGESFPVERSDSPADRLMAEQAAVTPDGSRVLVTASRDITETLVLQYAAADMRPLPTVVLTDALPFAALGISRDGQRILLSRNQWLLADGAALGRIDPVDLPDYVLREVAHRPEVVSPDSSLVADDGPADIGVYRVDAQGRRGEQLLLIKGTQSSYGSNDSLKVFSADSSLLAVATAVDRETLVVEVWEIASGELLASFRFSEATYTRPPMVFTPDNAFLVINNGGWIGRYRIR
ncbi:MAG TPA: hypothetical protein VGE07_20730 [Herpetosiphonaceae bacterium]